MTEDNEEVGKYIQRPIGIVHALCHYLALIHKHTPDRRLITT